MLIKKTSVSKQKSTKELSNDETEEDVVIATPEKGYIYPEKSQKNCWWIEART